MTNKQCPHCGHLNSPEATFCGECGRPLPAGRSCSSCGFSGNPASATYCVQCGTSLRRRKRPLIPFLWLGGVALVLVVAVVVLWQTGLLEEWSTSRSASSDERLPTPTPAFPMEETTTALILTSTAPPPTRTSPPLSTVTPSPTFTPSPIAMPSLTHTPSSSEPEGCIVFDSYRNDNWEVYLMNPDGSGLTNLTRHPANDGDPVWSPDGQRIVFDSDRDGNWEVYVMNADGSGLARLTNHPADDDSPTWLPDGQHVAFKSDRDGNWEIYVVRVDGSGLMNLTNHSAGDRMPTWSPDGRRVAFTSDRNGNWEIYVMNADGSGITNLTNHSAEDWFPAWSPDGRRIAFHSYRDDDAEIYAMNADGSELTRLTYQAGDDWGQSWSSDGSWIAFTSDRDGDNDIYVMRANGSNVRRLTSNTISDTWPRWAPAACSRLMRSVSQDSTPATPPPTATEPSQTPTSSCRLVVDPQLTSAWDQRQLGCPVEHSNVTWAAWETFEGGYMFWRNDVDGIYVLHFQDRGDQSIGYWEQMPEEWKWDGSNPEGVGLISPAGLYEPKRGFGWLWRTHLGGPESTLGWAEDEEKGFCATIQSFDAGLIFQSSTMSACEGDLYNWAVHPSFVPLFFALYKDGTWQRY